MGDPVAICRRTRCSVRPAGGEGSVWIWGLDGRRIAHVLATLIGWRAPCFTIAFHGDRPIKATGGANRVVRLWNIDPEQIAAYVCASAGS